MSVEDLLARQAVVAGLTLVISGLFLIVVRKRLVATVLGFELTALGAAVVLCRPAAQVNGWTAAMSLTAAALLAPVSLVAFARWTRASGRASTASLSSVDGRVDG